MSNIIQTTDIQFVSDANRIDSRIVAKALDVQHESFFSMLNKYKASIEEAFGIFRFQIGKLDGRGRPAQYVMLTEDQAIAAINLSRNTEQAVKAKLALVKAFSEARKRITELESQQFTRRSIPETIRRNAQRKTQLGNSKSINGFNMRLGGVEAVKRYNRVSCMAHCNGLTPSQIKALGKQRGLKSTQCTSAKEVLRHKAPHIAAAMSLTDDMILHGVSQEHAIEIGVDSQSLFRKMLAYGVRPAELDMD